MFCARWELDSNESLEDVVNSSNIRGRRVNSSDRSGAGDNARQLPTTRAEAEPDAEPTGSPTLEEIREERRRAQAGESTQATISVAPVPRTAADAAGIRECRHQSDGEDEEGGGEAGAEGAAPVGFVHSDVVHERSSGESEEGCGRAGAASYRALPRGGSSHSQDGEEDGEAVLEEPPLIRYGSFKISRKEMSRAQMKVAGIPDHSYSGVAFNVHCKNNGQHVFVNAFEISGQLNRIRIFGIKNKDVNMGDVYNNRGAWDLIHDDQYEPSWRKLYTLELNVPIRIDPGEFYGFFIHSDCRNDRGIKYRSCRRGKVMEDDQIYIKSGWAHTSYRPFDKTNGWYREPRVLAGNVLYSTVAANWSPHINHHFPLTFQHCAKAIIEIDEKLCRLPPEALLEIVSFCPIDWFDVGSTSAALAPAGASPNNGGYEEDEEGGRQHYGMRSFFGRFRHNGSGRLQDPWEPASSSEES